jgi:hypothetical protein
VDLWPRDEDAHEGSDRSVSSGKELGCKACQEIERFLKSSGPVDSIVSRSDGRVHCCCDQATPSVPSSSSGAFVHRR